MNERLLAVKESASNATRAMRDLLGIGVKRQERADIRPTLRLVREELVSAVEMLDVAIKEAGDE